MKKRKMTIFAVGDRADYDAFRKFNSARRLFLNSGFDYASIDYKHLLAGKAPKIPTGKVIVFLFFPFYYWNKHIEHKNYRGIYGNRVFLNKFARFCENLNTVIKDTLAGRELCFVNDPRSCAFYRDKLEVKKRLSESGVSNPKLYKTKRVKEVHLWLSRGQNFYAKPRCGSMGKGITYLSRPDWQTNFKFKDNKILSKKSDRGWKFKGITGNNAFLSQLLKKDIFIEEAVNALVLNKKKVDLRIYTFFGKTLYVYPRKNHLDSVTTNITQGGRGDPKLLKILPKHTVEKSKKLAETASRTLGFNLAGVDIAIDRNLKNVYVIDVNTFPGFPKKRTFDLTSYMIRELIGLLNKKKLRFEKAR